MPLDSRDFLLYLKCVETAMEDRTVTADESAMLKVVEVFLKRGDPEDWFQVAKDIVAGKAERPFDDAKQTAYMAEIHEDDRSLYEEILAQAMDDQWVTEDEWAILMRLWGIMGIDMAEHTEIEGRLRRRAMDVSNQAKVEKIERFFGQLKKVS